MKRLFLFRGLPGAGKSEVATTLVDLVVAADDFMIDPEGNYEFDPSRLKYCHQSCQHQIETWMIQQRQRIGVHNTFTAKWELQAYLDLATTHGYRVHVLHVENQHRSESSHQVGPEAMERMASRWHHFDTQIRHNGR